jgi:hypothetical protein
VGRVYAACGLTRQCCPQAWAGWVSAPGAALGVARLKEALILGGAGFEGLQLVCIFVRQQRVDGFSAVISDPSPREHQMSWYWIVAVGAVVLLTMISRRGEKADPSPAHFGSAPPSGERIDEFLRAGQKIEAIKEYRALHGVDLKSAKDAVEARARELGR